jgi:SAM-dependent methyltransferase
MAVHPLAQRFAAVADAYERGRPEYTPDVVARLATELGIAPGARVLDLAAGTGKLSRALLAAGFDVVAVEPLPALREKLATRIGAERVRDGVAEAIPLPDASVDAVTVADAFHWFDQSPALAEIRRVLRPGGGLALLTLTPDWSGASWAHDVGTLIAAARREHPLYDGPPWQEAVRAVGGWSEPRELTITTAQPADPARLIEYVGSISWVVALPAEQRARMLASVEELIHAGATPRELPLHVSIGLAFTASGSPDRARGVA